MEQTQAPQQFLDSGAIFQRPKTNDRQPDVGGEVTLSHDTLRGLIEFAKTGAPVKLELSGWKKVSGKGTQFISLKARLWDTTRGQNGEAGPAAPGAPVPQPYQQQRPSAPPAPAPWG